MDILFLAYANDLAKPLPNLKEEDDHVYNLLMPRAIAQNFLIYRDSYTTKSKISEVLVQYRQNLFMFSYSGHAGSDVLFLEKETVNSIGLAKLLGRCPKLRLVVLNGCSTQGQVQSLLKNGVPVVVATNSPVEDVAAKVFAKSFYQALNNQETIKDAFEAGIGSVKMSNPNLAIQRGIGHRKTKSDDTTWGLFYKEEKHIQVKLPQKIALDIPKDFSPNKILIEQLVHALKKDSPELQFLDSQEKKGKAISLSRQRMAVLNSLPAPIAEHFRKLLVPIKEENDGFDKPSENRLKQLIRVYDISLELLGFTLLAQLWEAKLDNPKLYIPSKNVEAITQLIKGNKEGRFLFDFIKLIRNVREIFDQEENETEISYFVPELNKLKELPYSDDDFMASTFLFHTVKERMSNSLIQEQEIPNLCIQLEEALAQFYGELGFLAKYNLAAVNKIDVHKYRHIKNPTFKHQIVRLIDLLGGLELSELVLERFTDNRSVILLREDQDLTELNLSPFIIDLNAFEEFADVSNVYFFSHYDQSEDAYFFYYVNRPTDDLIKVSSESYEIVKAQLDAFLKLLEPHI